jgi:arylsulfatase A-like enzyme
MTAHALYNGETKYAAGFVVPGAGAVRRLHCRKPPTSGAVRMRNRLLVVVTVICAAVVVALWLGPFRGGKPNVLLISVDTLRHDHLGYAGYDRPVSANIDALAARGIVFTDAHSQAGWTLPALASMLTGRYPSATGATDFHLSLKWGLPTVAGLLRKGGYDTRGFVSHLLLTPQNGLSSGFTKYDYSVLRLGHPHDTSTGRQLTDLAIGDLDRAREPFFMWVHYFDPHFEYLEHEEWSSFGSEPIDRYDQEIAFTDAQIGRLLDALEERGMLNRTIIVFTSDHGEEFGEHGGEFHYTSYEEVMRVPLLLAGPGIKPGTSDARAQQIDLLPTLLALTGVGGAPEDLPGKDLLAGAYESYPVYMERDRPPGYHQRAVIDGDLKLIAVAPADTNLIPWSARATFSEVRNVGVGTYAFDLADDPGETRNIYGEGGADIERLLGMLASFMEGEVARGDSITINEETREQMRALGYIQ